jgi:hypothetical protein
MRVFDQLLTVPVQMLKTTLLEPWVAPKPEPLICTWLPGNPLVGVTLDTTLFPTVNVGLGLLLMLLTVTATGPVAAPAGTFATIWLSVQLETVATVVLNLTVLVPCEAPNPVPVIVVCVPTGPAAGETAFTKRLET